MYRITAKKVQSFQPELENIIISTLEEEMVAYSSMLA